MPALRIVLAALPLLLPAAAPAQDKKKDTAPANPTDAVVKAWQNAGFAFGWHGTDKGGSMTWQDRPDGLKGALPAFRPKGRGKLESLPDLPDPKVPFALNLEFTKVTDAGLKPIAGLKSLTILHRAYAPVSDAGLKHLSGLKSLTRLHLSQTKVTDAGLKHLAGLKGLTELGLGNTQVTEAGLKHIADLK